jgi:beta-glucosidase
MIAAGWKKSIALAAALLAFAMVPSAFLLAQFPGMAPARHYAWSDKTLSPDQRADMVIKEMTLDEKIQMVHGPGWQAIFAKPDSGPLTRAIAVLGFIPGVPRLGIPDLQMTDSNQGISLAGGQGRYATALPSGEAMASAWDPKLSWEIGTLLGQEMRDIGFNMSLGSGVNLVREPRNGRIFEYKGEDPLLAGTLAGSELKAEKALHLITDLKHYAVNDQDAGRIVVNSILSKRAMRESDLLAFQIALRDSGAGAIMCSYNKINGTYACENEYTLTDVLKKDFGFKGFVVSDWGGTQSTVKAAMAGLDVEMPGNDSFGAPLKKAVEAGEVPMDRLNDMVHRILRTEFDSGIVDDPPQPESPNVMRGFEVAQKTEESGAVLLKNAGNVLPLKAATVKSIAVIGGHADVGVMSGGGSSQVSPAGGNAVPPPPEIARNPMAFMVMETYHRSVPLKGIEAKAPHAAVKFDAGADPAAAAALAKQSQVAIVFATQHASEGMDLANLSLPGDQDALIEAVAAANPHTIVVLESGGAVLMPWIDKVAGVVEAWYPGIRGSEAIANVLFGDVNPSGKLPLTFPKSEADMPHPIHLAPPKPDADHPLPKLAGAPGMIGMAMGIGPFFDVHYDEGLKVGYKWYDAENKTPLFPFGFGLSYTSYAYSDLKTGSDGIGLHVTFKVTNTGARAGEEIAQVYLTLPSSTGEPPKRLVGWSKVALAPGERKNVTVDVEPLLLSVFNADKDEWEQVPGDYKVWVGGSSRDLPLSAAVKLGGN